jgi:8-oxo-dGTP pyrophosphatase MutT (NUDIX family)
MRFLYSNWRDGKPRAGVAVTKNGSVLGCHPTGEPSGIYDLPKGHIDPGERPIEAAVRELREETGIEVDSGDLVYLGFYPYAAGSKFYLYWYDYPEGNIANFTCPSKIHNCESHPERNGKPEMDGYAWLPSEGNRFYMQVGAILALSGLTGKDIAPLQELYSRASQRFKVRPIRSGRASDAIGVALRVLKRFLERAGAEWKEHTSKKSDSAYLDVEDPYRERSPEVNVRVSDHALPGYYDPPDLDVEAGTSKRLGGYSLFDAIALLEDFLKGNIKDIREGEPVYSVLVRPSVKAFLKVYPEEDPKNRKYYVPMGEVNEPGWEYFGANPKAPVIGYVQWGEAEPNAYMSVTEKGVPVGFFWYDLKNGQVEDVALLRFSTNGYSLSKDVSARLKELNSIYPVHWYVEEGNEHAKAIYDRLAERAGVIPTKDVEHVGRVDYNFPVGSLQKVISSVFQAVEQRLGRVQISGSVSGFRCSSRLFSHTTQAGFQKVVSDFGFTPGHASGEYALSRGVTKDTMGQDIVPTKAYWEVSEGRFEPIDVPKKKRGWATRLFSDRQINSSVYLVIYKAEGGKLTHGIVSADSVSQAEESARNKYHNIQLVLPEDEAVAIVRSQEVLPTNTDARVFEYVRKLHINSAVSTAYEELGGHDPDEDLSLEDKKYARIYLDSLTGRGTEGTTVFGIMKAMGYEDSMPEWKATDYDKKARLWLERYKNRSRTAEEVEKAKAEGLSSWEAERQKYLARQGLSASVDRGLIGSTFVRASTGEMLKQFPNVSGNEKFYKPIGEVPEWKYFASNDYTASLSLMEIIVWLEQQPNGFVSVDSRGRLTGLFWYRINSEGVIDSLAILSFGNNPKGYMDDLVAKIKELNLEHTLSWWAWRDNVNAINIYTRVLRRAGIAPVYDQPMEGTVSYKVPKGALSMVLSSVLCEALAGGQRVFSVFGSLDVASTGLSNGVVGVRNENKRRVPRDLGNAELIESATIQELLNANDNSNFYHRGQHLEATKRAGGSEISRVYANTIELRTKSEHFKTNQTYYRQWVLLKDFKSIAKDKNISLEEAIDYSLAYGDVHVHCTCPSTLYHGFKYEATMLDYTYGLNRENRFPKITNPTLQNATCKHIHIALETLKANRERLIELFSAYYKKVVEATGMIAIPNMLDEDTGQWEFGFEGEEAPQDTSGPVRRRRGSRGRPGVDELQQELPYIPADDIEPEPISEEDAEGDVYVDTKLAEEGSYKYSEPSENGEEVVEEGSLPVGDTVSDEDVDNLLMEIDGGGLEDGLV